MEAREFLQSLPGPLSDEQIDIIVRAEGLCEYCGDDLLQSISSYCSSEFEHIDNELEQPHYDSFENRALSCSHCNKVKKDHIPPNLTREQFRELSREEKVERVAEWLKGKSDQKREHEVVESLRVLVCEKQALRKENGMRWKNEETQTVREMIYHESAVTNHRTTWLLQIQGFLFAAIAFSWDKAPAITFVVAAVGIAVSLSVKLALTEAADAIRRLVREWEDNKPAGYNGPGPVGGHQLPEDSRMRCFHPWRFVPILFAVAWVAIILIRSWTIWGSE